MKTWKIEIELSVDETWIDDGFDAIERKEQLKTYFEEELLPYSYPGEVKAEITIKETTKNGK